MDNNNQSVRLVNVLPRSGFIWPSRPHITSCHHWDYAIQLAIRSNTTLRFRRNDITPLLVAAYKAMTNTILTYEPQSERDDSVALYECIEHAQKFELPWAASIPVSIFAEFILEIKDSRLRALSAMPNSEGYIITEPAEGTLAYTLTTAVDTFVSAIEARGWRYNEDLMSLAGHDNSVEELATSRPAAVTEDDEMAFVLQGVMLDEEEEEQTAKATEWEETSELEMEIEMEQNGQEKQGRMREDWVQRFDTITEAVKGEELGKVNDGNEMELD